MRATIFMLLILAGSALALSGPFTYSGKEYYVVTTDPTEDTGDEACAKAGLVCVGYTEPTDAVCKLVHPSAASSSGFSGDVSGTYCDGAPQAGACSTLSDTCLTCPSCTSGVTCSQEIGSLYREMFVECAPGQCKVIIYASTVQDLINQVSGINTQLQACPQSVPSPADKYVKNGNTFVDISMTAGGTQSFTITAANDQLTGVQAGHVGTCVQKATVSEADLDTALNSVDLTQAVTYLVGQNKVTISGCTFIQKAKFFFAMPIVRFIARRVAPTAPAQKSSPDCGKLGEQCNNRACLSGMCAAAREQNADGQWGYWNYKCINQAEYNANCIGQGNTPPAWNCIVNSCR